MTIEARIPLFDLLTCISDTVDLVSPEITNHHMQVAYIACSIATELKWSVAERGALLMAGGLHDIGAFSAQERKATMQFEMDRPHIHARVGYCLLKDFAPFAEIARLVRFHHVPWLNGGGARFDGEEVPLGSHILHLADRIAVLVRRDDSILTQAERIRLRVAGQTPAMFVPELVEAFKALSARDYFWFDAASRRLGSIMRRRETLDTLELDLDGLERLANLFRRLIDFRSRFTATHSSGVAASAEALADLSGFSPRDCRLMRIAGYFHDLGKLAIPQEIIQKPARLSEHEYDIMRSHVYYTYLILEPLIDLKTLRTWGSLHQEYLDGSGYPFRFSGPEIPLGSRILAVADVFTALTEDRPYRKGLPASEALPILEELAEGTKLDRDVIALLRADFDRLNGIRANAQAEAEREYQEFVACLDAMNGPRTPSLADDRSDLPLPPLD